MKKLFLCLLLVTFSSNAQLGGLLKKTKDKVEKKAEDKIEGKTTSPTETKSESKQEKNASKQLTIKEVDKKFVNKIVFSHNFIDDVNVNESELTTEFNYFKKIHLRAFLDKSIAEYFANTPNINQEDVYTKGDFKIHFFFDGIELKSRDLRASVDISYEDFVKTRKTFRMNLTNQNPSPDYDFLEILNSSKIKLTDGVHKIRIEARPCLRTENPIELETVAVGEFNLTVKFDPNDQSLCFPKTAMNDKVLEEKIKQKYIATGGNKEVKRIVILNPDWKINRNKYSGVILNRELRVIVVSVDKNSDLVYREFNISQDYLGSKFDENIKLSTLNMRSEEVISYRCLEASK